VIAEHSHRKRFERILKTRISDEREIMESDRRGRGVFESGARPTDVGTDEGHDQGTSLNVPGRPALLLLQGYTVRETSGRRTSV